MSVSNHGDEAPSPQPGGTRGSPTVDQQLITDGRILKGNARRQEIVRTALDVFAHQGYRGGSLREIAQRVGISETGLLHHFGTKAGLLSAVLAERDRAQRDSDREQDAASENVTQKMDGLRRLMKKNTTTPGLVGLHTVLSAEAIDPAHPAHDFFVERYRHIRHQDDEAWRRLKESGTLRPDINPATLGPIITAVMDGLQFQWLLDPDAVDMPALFDDFLGLLETPHPAESSSNQ